MKGSALEFGHRSNGMQRKTDAAKRVIGKGVKGLHFSCQKQDFYWLRVLGPGIAVA